MKLVAVKEAGGMRADRVQNLVSTNGDKSLLNAERNSAAVDRIMIHSKIVCI
jgi:hypothetical protein